MKRTVSLLLLLLILVNAAQVGIGYAAAKELPAKSGAHWASKALDKWEANGLLQGDQTGNLQPDRIMTRAEFAVLINRVFNLSEVDKDNFVDVKAGQWYAEDMAKAKAAGYLTGYSDHSVKPLQPITREEGAAILARIFQLIASSDTSKPDKFNDADQISRFAWGAVTKLTELGFLTGYVDGTFKGKQSITRAEAISIMDRIVPRIVNKPGTYEGPQNKGNVLVNKPGITLKNIDIQGDLYLTEGIGEGEVNLDNITVSGNTFIQGGGENSIYVKNSKLNTIKVDKKNHKIHIVLTGHSSVNQVQVSSGVILENDADSGQGFEQIRISSSLPSSAKVRLIGHHKRVITEAATSDTQPIDIIAEGTIEEMELNFKANVQIIPPGSIRQLKIGASASGSTLDGEIGKIDNAADNVTYQNKILPKQTDAAGVPTTNNGSYPDTSGSVFTASAAKGKAAGTAQVSASAATGLHLVVKVSHEAITNVVNGTKAPTGGTVLNPYISGADISGVDETINKFIGVYLVDSSQNIKAFKLLTLTSAEIAPKKWDMVWDDEFDGTQIDTSKWNFVNQGDGFGNNELQYYTNRTDNARIEDGSLVIEARKENYQGKAYTSAKLTSEDKGHWTYGKYEVRAKLPKGQGMWPAIWMMPQDMDRYGTWPASGEIDIMEQVGHEADTVYGTLHYGTPHSSSGYSYSLQEGSTFADEYHTFTTEWEPGELRWYVDGILYAVQNDWFALKEGEPADYTYPAPFDRDFYMQLNLAVGGTWPGDPDAATVFPQKMQVDYVRVYKMDDRFGYRDPAPARPGQRDQGGITPGKNPLPDGNYIYNGTFDENKPGNTGIPDVPGSDYWTFRLGNNGAATVSNDNGAMKVNVTGTGDANYFTQLIQQPVPLQFGKYYKVSFDAKASAERSIEVKLGSGGDGGWKDYAAQTFNLGTTVGSHEFVFKMQAATHNNARLEINLGGSTGSVWLDNVRLVETADTPALNRLPLADGNYLYNGSFDQGLGRMGFWSWLTDGTGRASASVDPVTKAFKAVVERAGSTSASAKLVQDHIFMKRDAYYVVSFDGKSEQATDIQLEVVDEANGLNYSGTQTINLTPNQSRKQFYFRFDSEQDRLVKLVIKLGGSAKAVTLDQFRMDQRTITNVSNETVFVQAEQYMYQSGITLGTIPSGSTVVNDFGTGDSLSYLVDLAADGDYTFAYRVNTNSAGAIKLIADGVDGASTTVPNTGGEWQTIISAPIHLHAGLQMIELKGLSGEMKINWFAIAPDGEGFDLDEAGNLVTNGRFNDDLEHWIFWTEASASAVNDSGRLKVTANTVGGQSWSIQSKQTGIALTKNSYYTLSFDASASVGRKINVAIENASNNRYLQDKLVDIEPSTKHFSFDFEMTGASDPNAALVFSLGNVGNAGTLGNHQIWLDNVKLKITNKVDPLTALIEPGTAAGTTRVSATVGSGNHLAVAVGSASTPVPSFGDRIPVTAGVINPYQSGANLSGIDPVAKPYLAVYEANARNEIVKFKSFVVTSRDILPAEATDPADELTIQTIQPGSSHATTRLSAQAGTGHHLVAKVSHLALPVPNKGDLAPSGGTVTNPYASGSDISGVDAGTNKYVGLYEVDGSQRIVKFRLVTLQQANIKTDNWNLVWDDEFDGTAVDTSKWNFVQGGGGYGNEELQNYTNRPENVRVEDGALVIEARKENYQGSNYTSAKLDTSGKAKWTYGRYEIKAQLPEGQGLWPAIWMMPQDMGVYGTWPSSGEIDIMEALGHEPGTIHGTLHYGVEHASSGQSYTLPGGQTFTSGYHTYAAEWEPGEIRFYVDDILYAVQNDWFAYNYENPDVYTYPAPFDRDFYMQLNVAVGGTWPGNPDASSAFPQQMKVDYVRVYQLPEGEYRKPSGERPGPRDTSGSAGTAKTPTVDGNYIYNGGFDQNDPAVGGILGTINSNYWTFNNGTGFDAQATTAYDNGTMRVDIAKGGSASYAVQLMQKPIPVGMGKTYKISLDARASANRNIEVKISQGGEGGWTDYGKGSMGVTTEQKNYSYTFRMLSNTHNTARMEINLGGATGSVWVDNVRFEEVTDDVVVERPPLGDGNYIYNGKFELGANYTAFWNFEHDASANAKAVVNPTVGLRELHAQIVNGGTSLTSVQLKQNHLHLIQGDWYKVNFKARAEAARDIELRIAGSSSAFALKTTDETYSYIFKMTESTTLNGELQFLLGGNQADVYIDNVELKQYFPPLSLLVRAENFDTSDGVNWMTGKNGSKFAAFDDETDYVRSDITVAKAGEYIVSYKVSAIAGGRTLGVELDGAAKRLLAVPNTHGYEKWQVVTERIMLAAGTHNLQLSGKGVNLEWVELAPNLIVNNTMETSTDPWVLWVGTEAWAGSANAAMSLDNGEMKLDIQRQGSEFWSLQFNQMGFALKQGKSYRLSFDARSTVDRQIRVSVEQDGGSPIYFLNTVDLKNGMTRYTYDFTMDKVSQDNGKLNFAMGNVSGQVGPHQIYLDNVFLSETEEAVPTGSTALVNLALNKPATASSGVASLAFDGNMGTRWESLQSDPQSIQVDLGEVHEIDYIKLNWEAAYGKGYSIVVSTNGTDWTPVFVTNDGNGGTDEIRFQPVQARYVKLLGSARGTPFGYSLYEFAVYPFDPDYIAELSAPPVLTASTSDAIVKRDIDITFAEDNKLWRNSITSVQVNGIPVASSSYEIHPNRIRLKAGLFPAAGDYTITIQSIRYRDAVVTQTVHPIPPTVNLAANKPASASSGAAALAFDVNDGTRWISDVSDPQWISVDLEDTYEIGRVVLKWEGAYGKSYHIETSVNGADWTEVYTTTSGDGGLDTIVFAPAQVRYVRLTGTERGTIYSYSLWSFEVYPYDPSGLMTPPALTPNTAGSTIGDAVQVRFSDDPVWRAAISDILIDGESAAGAVNAAAGQLTIPASLLTEAKDYLITIKATGYSDTSVLQIVNPVNKAIHAASTASSGNAALAVDGNMGTRWESEQGVDPQWITVDIGSVQTLRNVIINWEGARASAYIIEVSEDGGHWTQVYGTTNGAGAKDNITFAPTSAQYVRITGTVRALPYGYSIYEIAIY